MDKRKVVCKIYNCLRSVGVKWMLLSWSFSLVSTDHWNQTAFNKVCAVILLQWMTVIPNIQLTFITASVLSVLHFYIISFFCRPSYVSCKHSVVILWHYYNKQSTVIQFLWSEGVWKFLEWQLSMRITEWTRWKLGAYFWSYTFWAVTWKDRLIYLG
jgi:hypothetical protein